MPSGEFVPKVPRSRWTSRRRGRRGSRRRRPRKPALPGPLAPTAAGEAKTHSCLGTSSRACASATISWSARETRPGAIGGVDRPMAAFRIWLDLLGRPEGRRREPAPGVRRRRPPLPIQAGDAVDATTSIPRRSRTAYGRTAARSTPVSAARWSRASAATSAASACTPTNVRPASAAAADAHAYAVGSDIVFGHGRFAPETREGRLLLAHELTHVVQQGAARPTSGPSSRPRVARAAGAVARQRRGTRVVQVFRRRVGQACGRG